MASISTALLVVASLFFAGADAASSAELLLPLTHTYSRSRAHPPPHHLLRSAAARSRTRSHRGSHRQQVSLPLAAGSDYTLTLSLGPTTTADLYLDTGSDLVWLPCSPFTCILCEGKPPSPRPPLPPLPSSSPVPCADPSCSAAHSSAPSSDLCSSAGCPLDDIETSSCPSTSHCPRFYYAYGDGSLIGRLRRGPLSLHPSLSVPNFTFACAHSALAEPTGVAGFGRGLLSLPNQLSPALGRRFSYCLVSHSFRPARLLKPSPLVLGRSAVSGEPPLTFTPMLSNPKYPYFYSVGLLAVSVGSVKITAKPNLMRVDRNGNGGMVVDSGTTFTMLPSDFYSRVSSAFAGQMGRAGFKRAQKAEAETGLKPCFYYTGRNETRAVPGLGLHFAGNASVVLPTRNYFMGFESGGERVGCLMMMDGGDEEGGPVGTLGNFQQQGFEVVYDVEEGRVGFGRRQCSALWAEMSRG